MSWPLALNVVARALSHEDLAWAEMMRDLILKGSSCKSLVTEALPNPWTKWIGAKVTVFTEFGFIWRIWRKHFDAISNSTLIKAKRPRTLEELNETELWCHSLIGIIHNSGVRR